MFVIGKEYVRREIHERYGGQKQGGISTPAKHDFIMLFTGGQGEAYGYLDGWTTERRFLYTGEGQIGDMAFVRGNRAIRDHQESGKALHLFEYTDRGIVRYIGEMVCSGYRIRVAQDANGNLRDAIIFELKPIKEAEADEAVQDGAGVEPVRVPLAELRRQATAAPGTEGGIRTHEEAVYERSQAVKTYVLRRANGVCEACGAAGPFETDDGRPYLETHQIRSVSDDGPDHPAWVAAVCPNCHRRAHYGRDRDAFRRELRNAILSRELDAMKEK